MQGGIAGPRGAAGDAAAAYGLSAGASSGNPVQKICLKRMRRGARRIEFILLVGGSIFWDGFETGMWTARNVVPTSGARRASPAP